MYALKVLTGANAGKVFNLNHVENTIGRSNVCDIIIPNKNISKKHAKIILDKNRVLFTDLNSTNGSFINGIKVEVSLIKKGDKIVLYDTVLEVVEDMSQPKLFALPGGADEEGSVDELHDENIEMQYASPIDQSIHNINQFLERSTMPPFYLALSKVDFKWLIGGFLFLTIFMTTLLSTIPLMNIIQSSVELESKRRASSLAKTLATVNYEALSSGRISATSVALGYKEPGVIKALIIRQENGEIIAPSRYSSQFPKESAIHAARKKTDVPFHVFKLNSETILAMHPIKFYSPMDGTETTQYYSVVLYNAKVLSVSGNKTMSLIVQTLFLSLLAGLVIFYFLFKIIEKPFKDIQRDIKNSLRDYSGEMTTSIQFQPLKDTYVAISSLLNRAFHTANSDTSTPVVEVDRSFEIQNLVSMLGYASIVINNDDETVFDYNPLFEELTNLYDIRGQKITNLTDQALQQNLLDLIERSRITPDQIVENSFDFSGIPYSVKMHPIYGSKNISYFVCSFFPEEPE